MLQETVVPIEPLAEASAKDQLSNGTAIRWFELCLVILLCFSSSIISSLHILISGIAQTQSAMGLNWAYKTLQEVLGLLLLGYVLWRRKLRFRDLGLRWSWRDLFSGILVTVAAMMIYAWGHAFVLLIFHQTRLQAATTTWTTSRQVFGHPTIWVAIPFTLLNPFFEELIIRAYLMTEIGELTGSWLLAGVVSVAVQTTYHLYYGWVGALSLAFHFIVYAVYYGMRRRAMPIIITHGIFDVLGTIKLWRF